MGLYITEYTCRRQDIVFLILNLILLAVLIFL